MGKFILLFLMSITCYACNKTNVLPSTNGSDEEVKLPDSVICVNEIDKIMKIVAENYSKNISDSYSLSNSLNLVSYKYGKLFSTDYYYLCTNIAISGRVYIDIYKLENDKFFNVLSNKIESLTYVGDSIFDVNGDGFSDFDIQWHPSSGCCVADSHDIYLSTGESGLFRQDSVSFINPNFDVQNKIVRGLTYGHPGEAALYKFRWNKNDSLDTLEYIIYHPGKKTYLKTSYLDYLWKEKGTSVKLKDIPLEYLDSTKLKKSYLDWFTGNI